MMAGRLCVYHIPCQWTLLTDLARAGREGHDASAHVSVTGRERILCLSDYKNQQPPMPAAVLLVIRSY